MPIDPAGTKPGLAPQEDGHRTVHMRCKREGCGSITAIEVSKPESANRLYRCTQCHFPVGVATGGAFNLG